MNTRLNTATMGFGTGSQRVEAIRAELDRQRTADRAAAGGSIDEDIARRNIADLEPLLAAAEANETLRAGREQMARHATAQREQDARAELEARLMCEYVDSAPGTTAAEATAALPDLLHRHRLLQLDAQADALALAKRRIRI